MFILRVPAYLMKKVCSLYIFFKLFTKPQLSGWDQIESICRRQIKCCLIVIDKVENIFGTGEKYWLPAFFENASYTVSLKVDIVS